jgi:hypothetical protein
MSNEICSLLKFTNLVNTLIASAMTAETKYALIADVDDNEPDWEGKPRGEKVWRLLRDDYDALRAALRAVVPVVRAV